jgi:hypothetical protein
VKTFEILLKCLPGFLSVGGGLYYVLAALFPFWREPGWNHWKVYDTDTNPNSWLVALGFEKAPKVVKEGDFSPRKATLIGAVLILSGSAGIIWVVHSSLNN